MVITPNGRYLYVPTFSGLAVISTARKRVVRTIPLPGGGPATLAMAPSGLTIYLAYANVGAPTYAGPPSIRRLSTATSSIVGPPELRNETGYVAVCPSPKARFRLLLDRRRPLRVRLGLIRSVYRC